MREEEKPRLVGEVFARVASDYDRMNDLMSLGAHRAWKRALVARLRPRPGERILDLAGGTGDIALRLLAAEPAARIVVADPSPEMLQAGQHRAEAAGLSSPPAWVQAPGEALPFKEASFDAAAVSFGLRNASRPALVLQELRRVLRHGARLAVLEFAPPETPLFRRAYQAWARGAVPALALAVRGERRDYDYLVDSIDAFAGIEAAGMMLREAGFRRVRSEALALGLVGLHLGWKI